MRKLFIFLIIIFLCSTVSGDRIYTWGKAQNIESSVINQSITSFDGFTYVAKNNGVFEVWKDEVKQADFIFAFSGTFNESPVTALSTDYAWGWNFIENNSNRIELEGKRQDFDSVTFPLKVNLVLEKYKSLKFSTYVENKHTTKDVTDLEMYFVFSVNTIENPLVQYQDENGSIKSYDWSTNFNRTDEASLANIDLRRIQNPKFNFLFQDIIDNNYFLTRLYFGNLNDLSNKLPDTNGFVIGFSKGAKRLNAGQSHTIDPTINPSFDGWDGLARAQDGVWTANSSASVGVGHCADCSGNTEFWWRRGYVQFDITSLTRIQDANFGIFFQTSDVNTMIDTCDFNISSNNATTTSANDEFGDFVLSSSRVVLQDINSLWFDETISSDINQNVTGAINLNMQEDRYFVNFEIAMLDEISKTALNDDICEIEFFDTGESAGKDPYIQYELVPNNSPDINLIAPSGGVQTNTINIDFNVSDSDISSNADGDLNISLYFSTTALGKENIIVLDANLFDAVQFTCDDADFTNSTNCTYSWDTTAVADGNYFVDIFIKDDQFADANSTSDSNFLINNIHPPVVSITAPTSTGTLLKGGSVYSITFNLSDEKDSAVGLLFDLNYSSSASQGTGTVIINDGNVAITSGLSCDSNIIVTTTNCSYAWSVPSDDANYFILLSATDDSNISFDASDNNFLVDSIAPYTTADLNNNVWQSTDANVILTCADGSGSGCQNIFYKLDSDDTNTSSLGAEQVFDTNILITADGNWGIQFFSQDNVDNNETVETQYILIDQTAPVTSNLVPSANTNTTDSTPTFTIDVTDNNGIGLDTCAFQVFKNLKWIYSGVETHVAGTCTHTLETVYALANTQTALVQWDVNDSIGNNSGDENSALYTGEQVTLVIEGGGGGSTGTGTAFSILGLDDDEKTITIYLPKFLNSEFNLLAENTGTRDINSFQIEFSENLLPYILALDVNKSLVIDKVQQYEYLFKTSELPEDLNSIKGSVFFFGNGVTQRYDIEFVFEKSFFSDILGFLNQGVLPLPFGVINLNGLLLIASGLVFVGLPRFVKLGATPQLVLAIPILGLLITAFFVGVIV